MGASRPKELHMPKPSNAVVTVWTAEPDAEYEPLKHVQIDPPNQAQANELSDEARAEIKDRVEAYMTPVSEETLRIFCP
jgi:hypothetical protein